VLLLAGRMAAFQGLFRRSVRSSSVPEAATTVVGTIRAVGGRPPGLNREIAGTVTATSVSGTRWIATTTATRQFALELPAGTYRFTGTTALVNSGQSECFAPAAVVVVGGKTTQVEVVCSIR
jgi:hypothetical protein